MDCLTLAGTTNATENVDVVVVAWAFIQHPHIPIQKMIKCDDGIDSSAVSQGLARFVMMLRVKILRYRIHSINETNGFSIAVD